MIEVHPHPADAFSDGEQSLTPDKFVQLMNEVKAIERAVNAAAGA
jgi:3-deoxy-7-phosphoheptulonate synthase